MKHFFSISILASGLLFAITAIQAQDCSNWGLWALRGTYTFTATAWQDLSVIDPRLPKGYAPVTIIGAFTLNGQGEVTGWGSINAGGLQLKAEFVNSQFSPPKADCSIPISLSMKMNEFGGVVDGPHLYSGVIAHAGGAALEIAFMMLGEGPGAHVELNRAQRISMNVD